MTFPPPQSFLHSTLIPRFLRKTYDLVDDPSLDYIISWGQMGHSFVVWEPIQFATIILPRNFKHNNFSSFVRQLNTYGFRKIDADKWEFANEGFVRGQRHLLRTIERRKSHHSSNEDSILGGEIESLRKDTSLMMEEIIELQDEQHEIVHHIQTVNDKVEAAERGHKRIVSFLLENPAFLVRGTKPKFVEHHPQPNLPWPWPWPWPSDSGQDECMVTPTPTPTPEGESFSTGDPILSPHVPTQSPVVTQEAWGYLGNYDVPDLGIHCGLPDVWGVGLRWLDEDSPIN